MSIFASKGYRRLTQYLALLLVPGVLLTLFLLTVEQKIRGRGLIESSRQETVSSSAKETTVKAVYFEVSQKVRKGDLVVEFEDLQGLRNQAEQVGVEIANLEDQRARMAKLMESGNVTQAHLKELDYKIAALKLKREGLLERAGYLYVRSPIDGEIVNIMVKRYESSEIGKELFSVSGGRAKLIQCALPERYFTYLAKGQLVNIKSELYNYLKYEVYHGRVTYISPYGYQGEKGEILHDVTITITEGNDLLKIGSAADIEIVTEKVPLIRVLFPKK